MRHARIDDRQSAAAAASIAIGDRVAVQDVDYAKLAALLVSEEQILELAE
jgi:alkylhydroperoxidase family enzyme